MKIHRPLCPFDSRETAGKAKERQEVVKMDSPTITNAFSLPDRYLENTVFDSTLLYLTYSRGFKSARV